MSTPGLIKLCAALAILSVPAVVYAQAGLEPDPGIAASLLAAGPLGAVILGLAWALFRVYKRLDEVQEARTKDAQEMARSAVEAHEKLSEALDRLAAEARRP